MTASRLDSIGGPIRSTASAPPRGQKPPGPRARYPGQFIAGIATDKIGLFSEMARWGDVTQIRVGPQRLVLLMHPDDIRRVLVTEQRMFRKGRALMRTKRILGNGLLTSEGEHHLKQRRLAQPAFHRERIAAYGAFMAEYSERTQSAWVDRGMADIHDEMMRLTLSIVARALFDADIENETPDIAEALELSLRMFDRAILPGGPLLEYLPIPWVRRLHRARRRLNEIIYAMIAERRAGHTDRGDLMSMLIAAHDSGDGRAPDGDPRSADRQIRDEAVTLLLAGHETTANALSWAWYLLSQHPSIEAKLHAELDQVLGGRAPTVDDMPRLTWTRSVLAESMRLYPPAWTIEREALQDFEAGGYTIKRGALVYVSQYLVHRDNRWWDSATSFDPGRWAPGRDVGRPKFAYFPFGAGTRVCIGEQFAWMEGVLVLATIAQKWRMRHEGPPPLPEPSVTLRPKGGLRMKLIAR